MVNEDHPTNWREHSDNRNISVDVRGKELCKEPGIDISLFSQFIFMYSILERMYAVETNTVCIAFGFLIECVLA